MDFFWKTAFFPDGYGQIGEILHGRIWPDWGLYGYRLIFEKGMTYPYNSEYEKPYFAGHVQCFTTNVQCFHLKHRTNYPTQYYHQKDLNISSYN